MEYLKLRFSAKCAHWHLTLFGMIFLPAPSMEFSEPYHSLPIREWRNYMKAHPNSYATVCVRQWLHGRRNWRLICQGDVEYGAEVQQPRLTR